MAVQTKRYFRLNELEKQFGILPYDIRYHIEAKDLHFSFLLPPSHLLMGKTTKSGFVGYGSGYYEGLVTVTPVTSLTLLQKGSVECDVLFLRQTANIRRWHTDYPFTISKPNKLMHDWDAKDLSVAQQQFLAAKPYPDEIESNYAFLEKTVNTLAFMNSEKQDIKNPFSEIVSKHGKLAFKSVSFQFSLSDACLLREDLQRLNLLGSDTASKPHSSKLKQQDVSADDKPNRPTAEPNRQARATYYNRGSKAKRIVSNLIDHSPTATASELWALLHESQSDDDLLDLIDPERVVLEVTTDKILWNVSEELPERQKQITRGTFNNRVTELKK